MSENQVIFSHVLFFGRKYEEVLSLFHLRENELRGKTILDCNSGPDAFVHEANTRGLKVTGCDPLYEKSAGELRRTGLDDIAHSLEKSSNHAESTGKLDVEKFNALKREALELFLQGYEEGKSRGWFQPGALPRLPFAEAAFDLVLSAHFLFIASHPRFGGMIATEEFDLAFHRQSLRELLRVTRREVRIFPITKIGHPTLVHPWAAILMGELANEGYGIALENNSYDQGQFTGPYVLVIRKEA